MEIKREWEVDDETKCEFEWDDTDGWFSAIVFPSFVFVSVFVITVDIIEKSVSVSVMMKTSGFQR